VRQPHLAPLFSVAVVCYAERGESIAGSTENRRRSCGVLARSTRHSAAPISSSRLVRRRTTRWVPRKEHHLTARRSASAYARTSSLDSVSCSTASAPTRLPTRPSGPSGAVRLSLGVHSDSVGRSAVLQFSRKERETVEVATPSPSTENIAQKSEGAEQSNSGTSNTTRPVGRPIIRLGLAAVLKRRVRSSRRETLAWKRDGNRAVGLGSFEDLERELSRSRRFGHSFTLARIPRSRASARVDGWREQTPALLITLIRSVDRSGPTARMSTPPPRE
jgi:hypothetical protein